VARLRLLVAPRNDAWRRAMAKSPQDEQMA